MIMIGKNLDLNLRNRAVERGATNTVDETECTKSSSEAFAFLASASNSCSATVFVEAPKSQEESCPMA